MTRRTSYLDYNATAPVKPAVIERMAACLASVGNPSSVHGAGRDARRTVEAARSAVARLLGARPADVVFTSGGTEANHLAFATGLAMPWVNRLIVSAIEHPSVLESARGLARSVEILPVHADGLVDTGRLADMLRDGGGRALVSVMAANNETGVIQPVAEIARIAAQHDAVVHCDAVQAAGKSALDMAALGVHLLSVTAHKLGGPQGVGALVVRPGVEVKPVLAGGGQESRRRAGTENVAGIAGFGLAAELAAADLPAMACVAELRDRLERAVLAAAPDAVIFGAAAPRLPTTVALARPGLSSETQVIGLDLAGVRVSAGSACSSGKVARSHVLTAMGARPGELDAAIRVSLGWATTKDDVDHFLEAWSDLYRRQDRSSRPAGAAPIAASA